MTGSQVAGRRDLVSVQMANMLAVRLCYLQSGRTESHMQAQVWFFVSLASERYGWTIHEKVAPNTQGWRWLIAMGGRMLLRIRKDLASGISPASKSLGHRIQCLTIVLPKHYTYIHISNCQVCVAQEVMRRHGAKAITVPLGALGAPSAKNVPELCIKATLSVWHASTHIYVQSQVSLFGTAPWLIRLQTTMSSTRRLASPRFYICTSQIHVFCSRRHQLKRIKSFTGLQITKTYKDAKGRQKCAAGPRWITCLSCPGLACGGFARLLMGLPY